MRGLLSSSELHVLTLITQSGKTWFSAWWYSDAPPVMPVSPPLTFMERLTYMLKSVILTYTQNGTSGFLFTTQLPLSNFPWTSGLREANSAR